MLTVEVTWESCNSELKTRSFFCPCNEWIWQLLEYWSIYRVSQKKLGSQNFQIAITHSFLKLESIVIPLNQMSRSREKICIGLKFNLVHFNGPQTKFKIFEIPVFFDSPCTNLENGELKIKIISQPSQIAL